jgi:methyltransferase family protein
VADVSLLDYLRGRLDWLRALELCSPQGRLDERREKKLREVAGLCTLVRRRLRDYLARNDSIEILEFACGKSYVGIVLALLLWELDGVRAHLTGVDINAELVQKCRGLAVEAGLPDTEFVACRTLQFETQKPVDLVVSLHACDTATDEAIAQTIRMGVRHVMAVPCCQNQIRGQIREGHALTAMTQYGPLRYRLANMLTDALRAQFLHAAGYVVELEEISSPRVTPKNLCICGRKSKRAIGRSGRDEEYKALKTFFGVKPKLEKFCPGVIGADED